MLKQTGVLAGLALAALLAGPGLAQDTTTGAAPAADAVSPVAATADTVVARVNGTEITLGHMIVMLQNLPEQYQTLPDDVLFKGILDQLVQQETLAQSIGDKLTKRDTLAVENERRGYVSGVALQSVVGSAVTDEALQAAYDARFKDMAPATEYNAAHILVATEDEAKAVIAEIESGADFAVIAKMKSTDTGSGANGGALGWFGTGMMVKPFEDAVVAATVGALVGPVKTDFGFHVIKVTETRIAAAPPLDELRDELAAEIEQKVVEAHIAELTKGAEVNLLSDGIDPAAMRDVTLLDE